MQLVELTVNGLTRAVAVRPDETLVEVLRREFQAFGVRESCGIGVCGACTILVDGRTVSSCLVLAALADGLSVQTVEGMGSVENLHPIQQAFVDQTAFQCSYCTPGFLMATRELLEENAKPSADEVRHALAGNLCRCGSYQNILAAVLDAAERLA